MKSATLALLLFCCISITSAQSSIWEGYLHYTKKDSLKLVLVVERQGDSLSATLDSPDQYAFDIPASKIVFDEQHLSFEVKSLDCRFEGEKTGEDIAGVFTQMGKSLPLTLHHTTTRKKLVRPQTPTPPYPYTSQEISFTDRFTGTSINGTLTLPERGKPKTTAILVSGSGWQDRDETILGHKPFLVIADALTREGYAVFRYDDADVRIVNKLTTQDFANQVTVILDSLSQISELQSIPMGIIGHSEGGLIAWMVAAKDKRVQFIVSLAGVGIPMKDIVLEQVMQLSVHEKLDIKFIQGTLHLNNEILTIIEKSKNAETAGDKLTKFLDDYTKEMTLEELKAYHLTPPERVASMRQMLSPWYFYVLKIRPEKYIKKVTCPVLALNGDKDIQVGGVENLRTIQNILKPNALNQFKLLPGLNHLFQECDTGFPDEYGEIEQSISPKALEEIIGWLDKLTSKAN